MSIDHGEAADGWAESCLALMEEMRQKNTKIHQLEEAIRGKVFVSIGDLAQVLTYVSGEGDIRVVDQETLNRLFAALKEAIDRAAEEDS